MTAYFVFEISSLFTERNLLITVLIFKFIDIFFLISTSIKVHRLSKSTNSIEHSRFVVERDRSKSIGFHFSIELNIFYYRFFTYLQIFGIMIITCFMEIYSWDFPISYNSNMVVEVIKCFSAVLIFAILETKRNVRTVIINPISPVEFKLWILHS